ncbi:MAG TPA: ATP-binding protein [Longimicrobium sp.]|nr:ATP-binding protein [Longimicrobium sp.]
MSHEIAPAKPREPQKATTVHPDLDASGVPGERAPGRHGDPGREQGEREAALRRGARAPRQGVERRERSRNPYTGRAPAQVASRAFATLAENVRDYAIFLMNPDGIITFWGEGARLIKWWTRDEAEGSHLRILYPDGGSEDGTAESHILEAVATGEYTGEGQRVRSDGSTFWAGTTLTALRDEEGTLIGFAKVTRDITARRAADAALKAASDAAEVARGRAEEADRAKSAFLATMSHEIRTPIQAVMGYTDLLGMELAGPLSERQHEYLARVRASSMHLLGIVDEVLDFSRLDAGRAAARRAALRLGAPVEQAIQMVQVQAETKGVHLADAVSGFAADVPCWGDEDRVRQVLVVLLSNAAKFTPPGGRITVSAGTAQQPPANVRLAGPGPWAYVRVEDTGPGIPPHRLAAIFEPFEQADMTHTRPHGGAGLGLAIARRLARLMDGELSVHSEEGVGTRFFLWLPAAAEEAIETTLSRSDAMDPGVPGLLQDLRDALLAELERVLYAYVARLRSDPATPTAHALSEPELEDHLATFLSDLAETLRSVDLAALGSSEMLRDGTLIQRTVAQRHGVQRRRLGWSADELRRDFQILREELAAAVRRRLPPDRAAEIEEGIAALDEFVGAAERASLEAFLRPGPG